MQANYAAEFERDMCCTGAELIGWLPGATRGCKVDLHADGADIALREGRLELRWHSLPPRRIALFTLPRLAVRFRFEGAGDEVRQAFMRYFDLYTQRGGG
jgi:hypothetical protein